MHTPARATDNGQLRARCTLHETCLRDASKRRQDAPDQRHLAGTADALCIDLGRNGPAGNVAGSATLLTIYGDGIEWNTFMTWTRRSAELFLRVHLWASVKEYCVHSGCLHLLAFRDGCGPIQHRVLQSGCERTGTMIVTSSALQ